MNHYEVLGVPATVTSAEIKIAFRKRVKKVHPDLNPGIDKHEFLKLNEAYEVLSDPTSRSLYDLFLKGMPLKTEIETVTPEQRYRANYKRNKAQKDRDRVAAQIVYTQKFYRSLRKMNFGCFILAVLLLFDFYGDYREDKFRPVEVKFERSGNVVYNEEGWRVLVSDDFYIDYSASESKLVVLYSSSILSLPVSLRMVESENSYPIKGSIYIFGNAIPLIIFICSLIVVSNKEYTDSRLTYGVISVLIVIWTLGMLIAYS